MPLAAQIAKRDLSSKWPAFITDIVKASKTSELVCENTMVVLKLLGEEFCGFSRNELATVGYFCIHCLCLCHFSYIAELLHCLSSQTLSLAAISAMLPMMPDMGNIPAQLVCTRMTLELQPLQ